MEKILKGKVALITGGGSGIGRATALAFAREGAIVAISDVAVENGEETARMVRDAGGEASFIPCNVAKGTEVKAMVDKTVGKYGQLDCAFNNAGIESSMVPIVDYPEEEWDKVISINLTGVWLCMKYEIPQMLKQGRGAIVNTASVAGLIGTPGISPYTASKHGVVGITKTAALEYATAGIRINAVCPGAIRTPMVNRVIASKPEIENFFLQCHPVGRLGTPEEIAAAVVWLCSDAASFVTGHAMVVDGGLTAQ